MGRFSRGATIASGSIGLFSRNPRLLALPLCSVLAVVLTLGPLAVVGYQQGLLSEAFTNDLVQYPALFVVYAVNASVVTFFNAGLVYCVREHLEGREATAMDGLREAWRIRRRIFAWALVAATVGVVLQFVQEKLGGLGRALVPWIDLAWSLATFFIVPVLALEERTVRGSIRRSGSLFRETWGESVTVNFGLGLLALPFLVVFGVLLAGWWVWSLPLVWGVAGALGIAVTLIGVQTVGMIARTALYRYASDEERVGPFESIDPATVVEE